MLYVSINAHIFQKLYDYMRELAIQLHENIFLPSHLLFSPTF